MTTIAILQARTTSSRLPGKVLLPLEGQPMIFRQLERIKRAKTIDAIVVATSTDPSDDELVATLTSAGYDVVRGPLDDVLGRFIRVLDTHPAETVVRLTADCPLISPTVIDLVVNKFHETGADYLSNNLTPTFPDGLDVEVVKALTLSTLAEETTDVHEREHVTLGVYRRHEQFKVGNFSDPEGRDNSHLRWTVDNPDDFAFVTSVYEALWQLNPDFDYQDVLAYVEQHPDKSRTDQDSPRNAALDGLDTGLMQLKSSKEKSPGHGSGPL
jgi:spore coat polysaccharide biosynthesis protein SpsF